MAERDDLYDLIWQVAARALLMSEESLEGTPLTPASGSMLIAIAEEPGATVADLSRRIPKTQQAISQNVARLEKLGLVERRLGRGRGVGLHLTDEGADLAEVALAREQQLSDRLRDTLGAKRSTALATLLRESHALLREPR